MSGSYINTGGNYQYWPDHKESCQSANDQIHHDVDSNRYLHQPMTYNAQTNNNQFNNYPPQSHQMYFQQSPVNHMQPIMNAIQYEGQVVVNSDSWSYNTQFPYRQSRQPVLIQNYNTPQNHYFAQKNDAHKVDIQFELSTINAPIEDQISSQTNYFIQDDISRYEYSRNNLQRNDQVYQDSSQNYLSVESDNVQQSDATFFQPSKIVAKNQDYGIQEFNTYQNYYSVQNNSANYEPSRYNSRNDVQLHRSSESYYPSKYNPLGTILRNDDYIHRHNATRDCVGHSFPQTYHNGKAYSEDAPNSARSSLSAGSSGIISAPIQALTSAYDASSPSPSATDTAGYSGENPRDARNRAEQRRRDKLNNSIKELATLVPLVVDAPRKIDKTGVLRLTAHDLRKEHVFGDSMGKCHMEVKPKIANAFLGMMNGFLICVTYRGIIMVITPNVETYLGWSQADLLGQNLLKYVHHYDRHILKNALLPKGCSTLSNGLIVWPDNCDKDALMNSRTEFKIRLEKLTQRSTDQQYETCVLDGSLRFADRARPIGTTLGLHTLTRRHRGRNEEAVCPTANDIVFVGMARVVAMSPETDLILEANKMEYRTRHMIDGRIIHCDYRVSLVAGYMTREVTGVSAFTFMHKDDVRWVMMALRAMYDKNEKNGESCYRLMSRTGDFIYLKTRGWLEVDPVSKIVESFVCVNTLVSEEEGQYFSSIMKKKYATLSDTPNIIPKIKINPEEEPDVNIEDPLLIENAIMHLVTNLNNRTDAEETTVPAQSKIISDRHNAQFSIIAPQPEEIKSAIAKSVTIISQTVRSKSFDRYSENSESQVKPSNTAIIVTRPSVVQMSSSNTNDKSKYIFSNTLDIISNTSINKTHYDEAVPGCSKDLPGCVRTSALIYNQAYLNNSITQEETDTLQSNNDYKNVNSIGHDKLSNNETENYDTLYPEVKQNGSVLVIEKNNGLKVNSSGISERNPIKNNHIASTGFNNNATLISVITSTTDLKSIIPSLNNSEYNNVTIHISDKSTYQTNNNFVLNETFKVNGKQYLEKSKRCNTNNSYQVDNSTIPSMKRLSSNENEDITMKRRMQERLPGFLSVAVKNEYFDNTTALQLDLQDIPKNDDGLESVDDFSLDALDDMPDESFKQYIENLTNPDSELQELIPQSLAVLETSIGDIDEAVSELSNQHSIMKVESPNPLKDTSREVNTVEKL